MWRSTCFFRNIILGILRLFFHLVAPIRSYNKKGFSVNRPHNYFSPLFSFHTNFWRRLVSLQYPLVCLRKVTEPAIVMNHYRGRSSCIWSIPEVLPSICSSTSHPRCLSNIRIQKVSHKEMLSWKADASHLQSACIIS